MRCVPGVAVAIALLLAGCASGPTDGGTTTSPAPTEQPRTLPAPIKDTKTVTGSFAGGNVAGDGLCEPEGTAQCHRYPFTANNTVTVNAKLTWTVQGNDFDLYLMQGDEVVSQDGINQLPPSGPSDFTSTSQVLNAEVEAGTYELLVVGWLSGQDTYTIEAGFS